MLVTIYYSKHFEIVVLYCSWFTPLQNISYVSFYKMALDKKFKKYCVFNLLLNQPSVPT